MFGHYCRPPPWAAPHCADGMTSVNVSIAPRSNHSIASKEAFLLGIVHYQDLEDALNRTYTMEDNRYSPFFYIHTLGQKPTFCPGITKNLVFEKCEFCEK